MEPASLAMIAGLALFNFAHRLWLLPRERMTFDSWGHLYLTIAVGRGGRGPFKPIRPQVVGAEDFYYPLLPHWIYSHLPRDFLLRRNHLINPLFESLFLIVALLLARAIGWSLEILLLAGLAYVFTPLWFSKLAIGPRVLNFTTRTFSELIFPLSLGILLFPLSIPDLAAISIGAVLLAMVLLGSKFGVQNVLLVTPVVALFAGSVAAAYAVVLAFIIALAVSSGNFARQLRQQGAHLRNYFTELRGGRTPIVARNNIAKLREWSPEKSRSRNVRRLVFNWFAHNSFTGVLLRAPHIAGTFVLTAYAIWTGAVIEPALSAMIAGAALVYVLTSLRWFLFLGEAERYLSHVSIWSNLLFISLCTAFDLLALAWLAIVYGAAISVAERVLLRGGINPDAARSQTAVMNYLGQFRDDRTLLVYPYHAVPPYRIMIETSHSCVFSWMSGEPHKQAMKGVEDYPRIDLARLSDSSELTAVDTLVIETDERIVHAPRWTPGPRWSRVEGEFGSLEVYERLD